MLKDEDFDEIGKRLHDLEADPPEDGWNRISGAMIPPPPGGPGKRGFVSRNWWKPLVLLIPVVLYFTIPGNQDQNLSQYSATDSLRNNHAGQLENENKKDVTAKSENLNTEEQNKLTLQKKSETLDKDPLAEIKTESIQSKKDTNNNNNNNPSDAGIANNAKKSSRLKSEQLNNTVNADRKKVIEDVASNLERNKTDLAVDDQLSDSKRTPSVASNSIEEEVAYRKDTLATNHNTLVSQTGNPSGELSSLPKENTGDFNYPVTENETSAQVLLPAQKSVASDTSRSLSKGKKEDLPVATEESDAASMKRDKLKYVSNPAMADKTGKEFHPEPFIADSLKPEADLEKATDSIKIPSMEKERETGLWRITATFSPHYMFKTIRPDENDEVLVTNINHKNSRYPERIGYGFAAGAGKEISKNIYMDAQLNYYTLTQNLSYSYATGNIDTLLQVRKADGNVYAIPVYKTIDSEINSRFNYGGLRLGTTYYFWENQRRRFNVSVFGGMNYRLSASIRERVNERWYTRSVENLNRVNYSVMFSGGYNIRFKGNWELMLNPMITYYSKNGSTSLQRISLRQKSYGVNVMISKTIGRK